MGGASAELVCALRRMPDRLPVYLPVWSAAQTLDTHTLSNRRYAPNLDGQATAESLSSRRLMTDFHQCVWPDGKGPDDMPQALMVSIAMVSIAMVSFATGRTTGALQVLGGILSIVGGHSKCRPSAVLTRGHGVP